MTGASRGIGAAVARLLASRGMRVVVNYRSGRERSQQRSEVPTEDYAWLVVFQKPIHSAPHQQA
ncbi:SDR family NAD(P)-dependent oxidoreductase [Nocardia sp. CA-135398]|uniref:SDR family NAD(P)-dependent oxidoreductase n=1 Tax=Nocardia sp. CA-135398 TaxID=3239977 RepID=UPI003D95511E